MRKLRLAILDMNAGMANQGMRCIREIAGRYADQIDYDVYDVRVTTEVPDLSYDLYISSGGPGDPRVGDGVWDENYYRWLQDVWDWNQHHAPKKHVFFICHSFQMAALFFGVAEVTPRRSMSFGTFPIDRTDDGWSEPLFNGLPEPFWAADFRRFQLVQPDPERLAAIGARILAIEKERPHVPLERAVMAIRYSDEIISVQFHPEADPDGMLERFREPEIKAEVIEEHGEEKWSGMIHDLRDPDKIALTQATILPGFIEGAIAAARRRNEPLSTLSALT